MAGNKMPCKDHLGHEFESIAEMCREWGISEMMYTYRYKRKKWSLKRTLTTPATDLSNTTGMKCVDHHGNIFKSKKDMCDHWRIPRNIFFSRIRAGWTQKQALETPVKQSPCTNRTRLTDHEGNNFSNVDELCAHWGISKAQFMHNRKHGLDMKRALTEKVPGNAPVTDHKGNIYPSFKKMLERYGVDKNKLRSRIELGWDLQSILENPDNKLPGQRTRDHLGNEYKTQRAMLKHYGVSYTLFKHRQKMGLDLATCLQKESIHIISITDHHGLKFATLNDLCIYWFLSTATYHSRAGKKLDIGKCILGENAIPGRLPDEIKILKALPKYYYLVEYEGHEYLWNDIALFQHARAISLKEEIARTKGRLPNGCVVKKTIQRHDKTYYEVEKNDQTSIMSSDMLFVSAFLSAPPLKTK